MRPMQNIPESRKGEEIQSKEASLSSNSHSNFSSVNNPGTRIGNIKTPMAAVELFQTDGTFKTKSKILQGASWIPCTNAEFPASSVVSGTEKGHLVLVVRTTLPGEDGGLIPGKLFTSHRNAYFPQNGLETNKPTYEVLVAPPGSLIWLVSSDGTVLPNAIIGGKASTGELLFIGRARHQGMWISGKIQPSKRQCIVSYDGKSWEYSTYEILIGLDPVLPIGAKLVETTSNSSKSADSIDRAPTEKERSRDFCAFCGGCGFDVILDRDQKLKELDDVPVSVQKETNRKKSSTKHNTNSNNNNNKHHKSSKSIARKKSAKNSKS